MPSLEKADTFAAWAPGHVFGADGVGKPGVAACSAPCGITRDKRRDDSSDSTNSRNGDRNFPSTARDIFRHVLLTPILEILCERYLNKPTARAMTSTIVIRETTDWPSIAILAQRTKGMTSVGLNAVALVKDMYR